MAQPSLLLVDDDRSILESMGSWLREQGFSVDLANSLAEGRRCLQRRSYQVVLVDVRLADGDGFELLAESRQLRPEAEVILITGYGTVELAVDALRQGAFDLLTKPLIDDELLLAIERAVNHRQVVEENKNLKAQLDMRFGMQHVVGSDARMRKVFDLVNTVADTKATILITGESGTGKSLIARAIHRASARRDKAFVEVACGALPETLLESELFGHVAGAFTGATGDRMGKFLQADGGTIFLDEIGTATPSLQVKLLRVLQEFEFEAVGGTKTQRVDARVILATNEQLEQLVAAGKFRQDLYYRVNVINIELPSLRDRASDVPLLAQHFLLRIAADAGRQIRGISDEALAALERYRWPGNVRELQNVIERAVLLCRGDLVTVEDLPSQVSSSSPLLMEALGGGTLKKALANPERQIILDVLESNGWSRQATAAALGINRTTLYKKMKRLGLQDAPSAAPPLAGDTTTATMSVPISS